MKYFIVLYILLSSFLYSQNTSVNPSKETSKSDIISKDELKKDAPSSNTSAPVDDCCNEDANPNAQTPVGQKHDHDKHDHGKQDHGKHGNHNHADHAHHNTPNAIAPAGVMGAHTHHAGSWMFAYRFMGMDMKNIYYNKNTIGAYHALYNFYLDPKVIMPMTGLAYPSPSYYGTLQVDSHRYMSVPMDMYMSMHMLDVMYSFTDTVMLMVMLPYTKNTMKMLANNFEQSNMATSGLGDITATLSKQFYSIKNHNFFVSIGLGLPTGSTDEADYMPMMGKSRAPYNMQPGSGTYSTIPGLAYTGESNKLSWGAMSMITTRNSKNENNYRLGNRYELTSWIAYQMTKWMSASIRVHGQKWDNVQGFDPALDTKMDPQNDPNRQGGRRTDLLLGANFLVTDGILKGMRFQVEYGRPIYQHLNGPQLGISSIVHVSGILTL